MLPVNDIFETIQGEATYTGTPSLFIRLQGCPVGCHWCDTKHTWEVHPEKVIPIATTMEKPEEDDCYANVTVSQLMRIIESYKSKHIVITGGEPALYDLWMLTSHITASGRTCQIETSGTYPIKVCDKAFVTVSPKLDMAGGREIDPETIKRANEVKFPVGKQADVDKLLDRIVPLVHDDTLIWLQPLSQNKSATALCIKAATENGWRVSVQTHKFIGVR